MASVKESVGADRLTASADARPHEIQATVLRPRPAPYFGTHVLLHIDDARAGRELVRRLTPHVDSAAGLVGSEPMPWLSVGISYAGLEALGLPEDFAAKLPRGVPRWHGGACAASLATWASTIRSSGTPPFGKGQVHIGVSAFSDSEEQHRHVLAIAREQYEDFPSVSVLAMQDFGAQPGDLNSLGYHDGIDQPPIEGSGVEPLPGQGRPIKAGEFILGYPGEAGVPLPMPQPDILGRNGTYVGFRKYQTRVGAFNRFLQANGKHRGGTGIARREAGRPLAQRRPADPGTGGRRPRARRGPATEQRLQLRERCPRPAGAVRKPYPADEPAGHGAHRG